MQVELITGEDIPTQLVRLIDEHDQIHIAVAWASDHDLARALTNKANAKKVRELIVGVDGFGTHPDFLDRAASIANAYVAERGPPAIFHPKIYYFQTGNLAEAIVGSANFTNGGMGRNTEAGLLIAGSASEHVFQQILAEIRGYERHSKPLTKVLADEYRAKFKLRGGRRKLDNPNLGAPARDWKGLNSEIASWTWQEYLRHINSFATTAIGNGHRRLENGLQVLQAAQTMFAGVASFADLPAPERKAISGVIGRPDMKNLQMTLAHTLDFGQFGTMRGAGDFAGLVGTSEGAQGLAAAIDLIPARGEITRGHFDEFVVRFHEAFALRTRGGGIPTASRLLAMKRPDAFVCVDGANRRGLAQDLDFKPSTISIKNYWERVIEPVRSAPWYQSPKPAGRRERQIWEGRVALLDIIYYEGD
ncbi:phospholipase D family protein [Sphingobium sp. B12D2B]|uniref:phospholipase D family protein n=1 Tax=Sphingobium sp. B12D2B TaxID=2940577 RepID=UPI002225AC63|nr:phospholipase D family protein [Sphingobium sp. B12D2B]MCW2349186.1 HKD family nuclease [Sphingobium sp. B12D2B]